MTLLTLLAIGGIGGWLARSLLTRYQGYAPGGVFVEVQRGSTNAAIARSLAEKGVVRSRIAFELYCRWRRQKLQAGEYRFDHPLTSLEVFRVIADGRVYVRTVIVPEGLTIFGIADLLQREGVVSRKDFLAAAGDASAIHDLAPGARTLEGFLFPATYQFPRHVTPEQVTAAMVRKFREKWGAFPQAGRNSHGLTATEVVTLASLVERETGVREERPMVAGVFYNRLHRGMALQCDPTVIYALELADKHKGSLSASDLQFKSPYNTYRNRGLPPGPIGNPGEASLRAALFPPDVDYLYFVANLQGGHFFSRTLDEHNQNVSRYRRMLAEQERNATQRPGSPAPPQHHNPR